MPINKFTSSQTAVMEIKDPSPSHIHTSYSEYPSIYHHLLTTASFHRTNDGLPKQVR